MLTGFWQWLKGPVVYARISRNRMHLRDVVTQRDLQLGALEPFSSKRMLVANFSVAEKLLQNGLKQLFADHRLKPSPIVLMQPLELIEGGLSQIEERALLELAAGAGARKVIIWAGHVLTDHEVLTRAGLAK